MKVLMVNKFLYPNGGSETYIFKIGECLKRMGHEVQYFGMEDERNVVGNEVGSYTSNMNFHSGKLQRLLYPFKIIYSFEAKRKISKVLEDFTPDVVHVNNFNFQLTPSILYEIRSFEKKKGIKVPIVYTAHDSQLICPGHLMQNYRTGKPCMECLGGKYSNCTKNKCIHGSFLKSMLGSIEAYIYKWNKAYRMFDVVLCPSRFLADKLATNKDLRNQIVVRHNFIDCQNEESGTKTGEYILYFGRYSKEKGIETLLKVVKKLPDIPFVFAGNGPLEEKVEKITNIKNLGFLPSDELAPVIRKALFTVMPSECNENCPFSVMESQIYGTPVLGAKMGGIPELVDIDVTGELFEAGNVEELEHKINELWNHREKCEIYALNCNKKEFENTERYCKMLIDEIYC